jgi:hypothetical protein
VAVVDGFSKGRRRNLAGRGARVESRSVLPEFRLAADLAEGLRRTINRYRGTFAGAGRWTRRR